MVLNVQTPYPFGVALLFVRGRFGGGLCQNYFPGRIVRAPFSSVLR
ncbi:MAG: hypothetical protein ANABAC_1313 [Anaerolineae bacterium]|nr:MAG: hypothetical protein ANABAC_1313 [Anaerolineae bacterium]